MCRGQANQETKFVGYFLLLDLIFPPNNSIDISMMGVTKLEKTAAIQTFILLFHLNLYSAQRASSFKNSGFSDSFNGLLLTELMNSPTP